MTQGTANTLKMSFSYRTDVHNEQQTTRPSNAAARLTEPNQEQAQRTWSVAAEDTVHLSPIVDLVGGTSYERYAITKAQEYSAARGTFDYPLGGADAFNVQGALIVRLARAGQFHGSVSDRSRFPVIFELYSTRFGTATPNPDLGPEGATNLEAGWNGTLGGRVRLAGTLFHSRVRDLIQTVVLADTTTQTQNVGNGRFSGVEVSADLSLARTLTVSGNYTLVRRTVTDALQPNLRPTGVPTHKALLYGQWRPVARLQVSPNLDLAGDRWSDVNPAPAFPYVRTGAYALLNLDATLTLSSHVDLSAGGKNLGDENVELAWGFPQPGRSFYLRTRVTF